MDWFVPLVFVAIGAFVGSVGLLLAFGDPLRPSIGGFVLMGLGLLSAAIGAVLALMMAIVWLLGTSPAAAHDAPTGWSYPFACCSGLDCRPAKVAETPTGFVVPSGEIVPMTDSRVRPSPDGLFHWCSVAGSETGRTICLFAPPRSF